MNLDLTGKRAVVTGSTQGIGWATALGLAECGAEVVLTGRNPDTAKDALERIWKELPQATASIVVADLATPEGVAALLEQVPDTDILVNNLGIFAPVPFLEITDAEWLRFFEVNVLSGIRTSRAYLPGMLARDWGRVVFVSSESALQIPPEMMHYGMTKTAQLAVSRGLAEMCAGTGVTVNSVLPGPTATEGVSDFVMKLDSHATSRQEAVDEFVREHRSTSILRRAATPREVANMVVYLCSPAASATTGAALSVDGGTRRAIF